MKDNITAQQKMQMWDFTRKCIEDRRVGDLLDNLAATTTSHILDGVCYGLDFSPYKTKHGKGYLSISEARRILNAIGAWEPTDQRAVLRTLTPPSPTPLDNGQAYWPVDLRLSGELADQAWGRIFGIEAGWMTHISGSLEWTELGRNRYAAGESCIFVESSGQAAFAF